MPGQPTGTVTLLFSDMEGSTRLLSRLGDRYGEALDAQRSLLRGAWTDHDGYELGTEGDSFYVAFSTAELAVSAVADAQRQLATHAWPDGVPVRVRMGLHTGAPLPHAGAYVGIDVHRAARISAAAHGGQIVVSSSTAALVAGSLPEGTHLRDLGDHRLKDLESPEHVFQLDVEGLPSTFPPLRSLGASSNLPTLELPTVGRDRELGQLLELIEGGTHVLTLTGPGGAGKTTLAISLAGAVGARFPDGVFFAPLAEATDEDVMWSSLAESAGLPSGERDADSVCTAFASRRALLVVDNLEQLPAAAEGVRRLVAAASGLVVLATSRRPLHLSAEQEFAVGPLELPDAESAADAARSPAIQLFVNQARRVRPGFELTDANAADVVAICRRLDGMPLGVELAAARCKLLSPHAVLDRLTSALDLSSSAIDLPDRHRTLRDTITWSYDLLEPAQREVFENLGAFVGGAPFAAIAAVSGLGGAGGPGGPDGPAADPLEVLLELADASLASIDEDPLGGLRVTQLETVRTFARERLESSGRSEAVLEAHTRFYAANVEVWLRPEHADSREPLLATPDMERPNVLAALGWAFGDRTALTDERLEVGLHLLAWVKPIWDLAMSHEGIEWLERGLGRAGDLVSVDVVRCLAHLSNYSRFAGHHERSHVCATRALEMVTEVDAPARTLAYVLRTMAIAEAEAGRVEVVRDLYAAAVVAGREAEPVDAAAALWEAGWFEMSQQAFDTAAGLFRETHAIAVEIGEHDLEIDMEVRLATILHRQGRSPEAERRMREALGRALVISNDTDVAEYCDSYGSVLTALGRSADAVRLFTLATNWHLDRGVTRGPTMDAVVLPDLEAARAALTPEELLSVSQERGTTVREGLRAALEGQP